MQLRSNAYRVIQMKRPNIWMKSSSYPLVPGLGADSRPAETRVSRAGPFLTRFPRFEFNGSVHTRRVRPLSLTFNHYDGVNPLPAGCAGSYTCCVYLVCRLTIWQEVECHSPKRAAHYFANPLLETERTWLRRAVVVYYWCLSQFTLTECTEAGVGLDNVKAIGIL